MTRYDSLGQAYNLTGFGAFMSLNLNKLAAGDAVITDAPAYTPPAELDSFSITTLTAAAISLAYTPTPLAAGNRIFLYASPQMSAGRTFVSDMRLLLVTAAAAATPINAFSAYQARFGTPVVGNKIFFSAQKYSGGYLSGPILTSGIVA
jgi:hypothetical protein